MGATVKSQQNQAFRTNRMSLILIAVCMVCCMACAGCASKTPSLTGDECLDIIESKNLIGPIVAVGKLVEQGENNSLFRISEVLRGDIPSNVIRVVHYSLAEDHSLPSPALLVLEKHDSSPLLANIFFALGDDAELGVLPYSREERYRIMHMPASSIMSPNIDDQLEESKAVDIARRYVKEHGYWRELEHGWVLKYSPRRDRYHWNVTVYPESSEGMVIMSDEIMIIINDRGEIKDLILGL